jgi:hypothetical protein
MTTVPSAYCLVPSKTVLCLPLAASPSLPVTVSSCWLLDSDSRQALSELALSEV